MAREDCGMSTVINGTVWCDYYDYACMKCEVVKNCPEGLDDDEWGYDEDDDYDDYGGDRDYDRDYDEEI